MKKSDLKGIEPGDLVIVLWRDAYSGGDKGGFYPYIHTGFWVGVKDNAVVTTQNYTNDDNAEIFVVPLPIVERVVGWVRGSKLRKEIVRNSSPDFVKALAGLREDHR